MLDRLQAYLSQLQTDPVGFLITMAYTWGVILFSLVLHECAHGYMALKCGDPTAKMMGRLSLNPLRHLDPLGTLCMFLLGFGWAKPVPVNPRNFRDYRWDDLLVSIAGIALNLTIFLAVTLLSCIINRFLWTAELVEIMVEEFGSTEVLLNPFYGWVLSFRQGDPGLGASTVMHYGHELMEHYADYIAVPWLLWVQRLLMSLGQVNLILALFNLLPIPPLDGFHVLNDTILRGRLSLNRQMFMLTQFALIALVMGTDLIDMLLNKGGELIGGSVIRLFMMLTAQM